MQNGSWAEIERSSLAIDNGAIAAAIHGGLSHAFVVGITVVVTVVLGVVIGVVVVRENERL